jgi:hypothetical protein
MWTVELLIRCKVLLRKPGIALVVDSNLGGLLFSGRWIFIANVAVIAI